MDDGIEREGEAEESVKSPGDYIVESMLDTVEDFDLSNEWDESDSGNGIELNLGLEEKYLEIKGKYNTVFENSFSEEIWESTYKHFEDKDINDTLFRVAKAIASVEEGEDKQLEWTEKFYEMLSGFKVTPGGRIISNAGTGWKTSLINCTVSPAISENIDSIEGISKVLLDQMKTLKAESGWGENFCIKFDQEICILRDGNNILIEMQDIKIGDNVISNDGDYHKVEEVFIHEKDNMIKLEFDSGDIIHCTDDHSFLVFRDGIKHWIIAKDLLETDEFVSINDN